MKLISLVKWRKNLGVRGVKGVIFTVKKKFEVLFLGFTFSLVRDSSLRSE